MTDQKMIAAIFNDFMSLYRGTSQIGIQEICKKYENHRMLMGLQQSSRKSAWTDLSAIYGIVVLPVGCGCLSG